MIHTFWVRDVEEEDAAPSGPDAGLMAPGSRVLWILHGERSDGIPACSAELWWYDELVDRWIHQGGRRALTDGALVEQPTYGGRVAIRLHDPRGKWRVHHRFLD